MPQIEICLTQRDGSEENIERPLHFIDGKPAITYKRRKWPIDSSGHLDLRKTKPFAEDAVARTASYREAAKFKIVNSTPPLPPGTTIQMEIPPSTPPRDPADGDFDQSQIDAINAPADARLLVDAGPGTGKTAVACARVAWLAKTGGVPPSKIWLISFTRTAVHEIRSRIKRLVGDPMIARAVQVGTLDSIAWQINKGYNSGAKLTGDFDDNIRALLEQLTDNEPVREYLSTLQHLIIDEAQDVVGPRADLLFELINVLPPSCGITVFADEAQAIYGFSELDQDEVRTDSAAAPSLPARIRTEKLQYPFIDCVLTQVHRTSDPKLLSIFTDVRAAVLASASDSHKRNEEIRNAIQNHSHGQSPNDFEATFRSIPQDSFVLYRRRGDALMASSMLSSRGISHRIRMSGLPTTIPPWIAATLGETEDARIDQAGFEKLWQERAAPIPLIASDTSVSDAWRILLELAPDKTGRLLDIQALRRRLAMRPPPTLVRSELGASGPILGTIHAAKGRESDTVHLMLPGAPAADSTADQTDEETRILFVGATRARASLFIGKGFSTRMARLRPSGRVYRFFRTGERTMCSVEIGLRGDLKAQGLAGRQYFKDSTAVRRAQNAWITAASDQQSVTAFTCKFGDDWQMAVREEHGSPELAVFETRVNEDLWEIAKQGAKFFKLGGSPRSPKSLLYIRMFGLTTLAIRPDDPQASLLHDPWQKCGLILAPLLYGFCPFNVRTK